MRLTKKIIPVAIVLLFLGIASAPALTAGDSPKQTEAEHTMTIYMPGITEDHYSKQMKVTDEQLNEMETAVTDALQIINDILENGFTQDKLTQLKVSVRNIINKIKELDDEFPEETVTEDLVEATLGMIFDVHIPISRAAIFSIGRGAAWIPFYGYESFFGMLLRPMFFWYTLGFSAVVHVNLLPPRVEYADRLGIHRIRTMVFNGLFLNFGDVGIDRVMGPVLVIGRGLNYLGEDIP